MTGSVGPGPGPQAPPPVGGVLVAPEGAFDEWAAAHLASLIRSLADIRSGSVSVALAGGDTPRPVYGRLSAMEVPWPQLEIFFGDERAVAPDDPASNYRMARESLLDAVPIPADHVHRMRCESQELEAAAHDYAALLPDALDLLLLGIGRDGHTASLFPGDEALHAERPVVPATAPAPPRARLTVTPPVLERARQVVVLASGSVKAGPVARALDGPWDPMSCPAQLARRGTWLLDEAAASALAPRPLGASRA